MAVTYTNADYAASRLNGTLVKYNGLPHYVNSVYCVSEVNIQEARQNVPTFTVHLKDIDLEPFIVGNYNSRKKASDFLVRLPARQWKQGLRTSQIWSSQLNFKPELLDPGFISHLKDDYPSIETCAETIACGEMDSMAFDKLFSVERISENEEQLSVLFKGKPVGKMPMKFGNNPLVKFSRNYEFLEEQFAESMEAINVH